ncbi:MAG: type II toxin-antitoxin system VapC family toxin [Pseudonocardia sp.]
MLIYCDSSALVKLVAEESESRALEEWLSAQPEPVLTSSVLARTEVLRAVRRLGPEAVDAARELLADLAMVALDGELADHAGGLDPAGMRSLDALHLAAAARLGPALGAFVAYDKRLAEAAAHHGLTVSHPGQD